MSGPHTLPVLLLFSAFLLPAASGHIFTELYRPLYEAQRGPLREVQPNNSNTSTTCVQLFGELLANGNTTAESVMALDSFGKPGSGLLAGNWAWLGHFSECSSLMDFKYCLLSFEINATKFGLDKILHVDQIPIQWGVCAPKECSNNGVHGQIVALLDTLDLEVYELGKIQAVASCVNKPVVPYNAGFYITMVICGIIFILMTAGSIIDIIETRMKEGPAALSVQSGDITPLLSGQPNGEANGAVNGEVNGDPHVMYQLSQVKTGWRRVGHKFLSVLRLICLDFAFNRNLAKLMKINQSDKRSIDCLNGIRILSMLWVILGHVYFFPATYGSIFNPTDIQVLMSHFNFQIVLNAYFSVDSFFFLSGLLVCNLTLLKMEKKNGKMPWAWLYVHRYLRLTPVLIATMMVWMYIAPYTMWGPKADMMAQRVFCPKYWWANLLYIQNFYPAKFGGACIAWTWYLANDMQFFIISPIIIYALYRMPYIGLGMIGALLSMCFAVTGALMAHYDFPASPTAQIAGHHAVTADYGNIIYQKPYVRAPPYLVGMLLGYVLYRLKDRQFTIKRLPLAIGWTIAAGLAFALIFGLYGDFNNHPLTEAGNVAYEMLSRFAWGVFLSWVVVACKFGSSGWVNTFLSWKFWIPLSRLTYTAYLLHPIVIMTFLGNFGTPFYLSHVLQVFFFFGVAVVGYLCAVILSLAVEFPIANLEKHLIPKL